jgi:hypothetical protein
VFPNQSLKPTKVEVSTRKKMMVCRHEYQIMYTKIYTYFIENAVSEVPKLPNSGNSSQLGDKCVRLKR